ncbi:uncharacterized protein LOC107658903 [Sinocyclocheilus anshuiensis]|uniref:Uncharacterized LOC107658903 n=1 Tax=Sinocyclocheilus anshuiensis TaxID=1608454 RepID=A0A671SZN2_9TELE|nr:PREDICTED: uncharacterized protein LOC107658903 [Sinocyclocheilus anshuiensis]
MHIKTGTWESSNAVCESDPLCDPAVLVSPPKPEPQIRNRRLSPGSGSCGGGGGGCSSGMDKRQASPSSLEGSLNGVGHTQTFMSRERRVPNKSRSFRRDGPRPGPRSDERHSRTRQTERWVENSLSLLKPPPAFPVKDSPAKLQPAVSYASKVKAGGGSVGAAEEPPGIGVLLQNQWGLSFISDGPEADVPQKKTSDLHPIAGEVTVKPTHASSESLPSQVTRGSESSEELLLSCRHLEEALEYHTQEWKAILWRQKQDPAKVVWYKNAPELPA